MRSMYGFVIAALVFVNTASSSFAADGPPAWAYGTAPGAPPAGTPPAAPAATGAGQAPQAPADTSMKHLPGSSLEFTLPQVGDPFGPADWFPGDHPQMPDIVAHGKKPAARACSLCHYPNGKGRPENASVSGLPAAYVMQQLNDFRDGKRKSAEPKKANTLLMIGIAKSLSPEEMKQATDYFF